MADLDHNTGAESPPSNSDKLIKGTPPDQKQSGSSLDRRLIDPSTLPREYGMIYDGACLEPEIANGATLMFDRDAPVEYGDFVLLYVRPERVRPGGSNTLLKRLVMGLPDFARLPWHEHPNSEAHIVVIAEQINPRRQLMIPAQDLLAMHKCLGPVPDGRGVRQVSDDELKASLFDERRSA